MRSACGTCTRGSGSQTHLGCSRTTTPGALAGSVTSPPGELETRQRATPVRSQAPGPAHSFVQMSGSKPGEHQRDETSAEIGTWGDLTRKGAEERAIGIIRSAWEPKPLTELKAAGPLGQAGLRGWLWPSPAAPRTSVAPPPAGWGRGRAARLLPARPSPPAHTPLP